MTPSPDPAYPEPKSPGRRTVYEPTKAVASEDQGFASTLDDEEE